MNDPLLLALCFALLAFAGLQPGHAEVTKVCRVSVIAAGIGC